MVNPETARALARLVEQQATASRVLEAARRAKRHKPQTQN